MTHPCACCALRFRSTGELRDHIATEHVERRPEPPVDTSRRRLARRVLTAASYSRSGWAR